jgi:hypothetical protein
VRSIKRCTRSDGPHRLVVRSERQFLLVLIHDQGRYRGPSAFALPTAARRATKPYAIVCTGRVQSGQVREPHGRAGAAVRMPAARRGRHLDRGERSPFCVISARWAAMLATAPARSMSALLTFEQRPPTRTPAARPTRLARSTSTPATSVTGRCPALALRQGPGQFLQSLQRGSRCRPGIAASPRCRASDVRP